MVTWQNNVTPGFIGTEIVYNLSPNERKNKQNSYKAAKELEAKRRNNVKTGRNKIEERLLWRDGLPYMNPTTNLQRGIIPNYTPDNYPSSYTNFLPSLGINLAGSYAKNSKMEEGRAGFSLGGSRKRRTRKHRKSRR
jgi:hypothetical protein